MQESAVRENEVLSIVDGGQETEGYPYNDRYNYSGKHFGDALVLLETGRLSHEEWEAVRTDLPCIGGSDAATVLGYNKYKSAMMLWSELTGITKRQRNMDPSTYWFPMISEAAYWGHIHEPQIRATMKGILEPLGIRVEQRNAILTHAEHKFMICDLDGVISAPAEGVEVVDSTGETFLLKGRGVLECKSASEYLKDQWGGDELPEAYYIQVQHNLAVTGFQWAIVPALVGGNKFNWKVIPRNEEYIRAIMGVEIRFWTENYLGNTPPELDGSKATEKWLKEQFPTHEGEDMVVADEELDDLARGYAEATAALKELEARQSELKNKIIQQIGEAPGAKGCKYKWSLSYKKGKDSIKTTTDFEAVAQEVEPAIDEILKTKHTAVRINWDQLIAELQETSAGEPLEEIIAASIEKHSETKTTRKGSRTFRFTWKEKGAA